jgi:DNA-binding transcriptional MerR regulator
VHVAQGSLCPIDQAERQLALLRMLTSHFPNTDLRVSLAELESLLAQCVERKAEEQRNTDKELAAAKQQGVQQVREAMEQKIQQMISQLEDTLRKNHFSESERQEILTRENAAGKKVLDGIGKK